MTPSFRGAVALTVIGIFTLSFIKAARIRSADVPKLELPVVDQPRAAATKLDTAVLAGGCFWGVQAVFQHTIGVRSAISGYSGGITNAPNYAAVSSGTTGHAESVQVIYDESQITFGKLLQIFYSVVHDPTELNRQGPDHGTQYRSAIFTLNDEQRRIANAYIAQLTARHAFAEPIVTQVSPLTAFYPAEDYHQNYAKEHPYTPYILINDAPKISALKKHLPDVWRE